MTEPSSDVARAAHTNAIYQALGRFFIEFSRLVKVMEHELYIAIGGNQLLLRSVTAELTADPIARAWRSVMIQAIELSDEDRVVLSGLAAEISTLISLRNDWAHGAWLIGYGNKDRAEVPLHRFKNTAKGLGRPSNLESLPTAEYIAKIADHTAIVADAAFSYGVTVTLLQSSLKDVRPSDRIRVEKLDNGRRRIQVSQDGKTWQATVWPSAE